MDKKERIYNIIFHLFVGTITKEESEELDKWLAESPSNKNMFEQFMQRKDMYRMTTMPRVHRCGGIVFADDADTLTTAKPKERNRIVSIRTSWIRSIAAASVAVVLLAVGTALWNDYCKIEAPKVDETTLAVMRTSREAGRSDASVTIRSRKGKREDLTLASSVDYRRAS